METHSPPAFLFQLYLSGDPVIEIHIHKCVSMVIINPFKLTMKMNHLRPWGKTWQAREIMQRSRGEGSKKKKRKLNKKVNKRE